MLPAPRFWLRIGWLLPLLGAAAAVVPLAPRPDYAGLLPRRGAPGRGHPPRGRQPAPLPAPAYPRPGRRHHAFAPVMRALVLLGHLARCLFAPGRGLAPDRPDAPELVLHALE